jgi:hypothetical protein
LADSTFVSIAVSLSLGTGLLLGAWSAGDCRRPNVDVARPMMSDINLLLATRFLRAFGFGFSAVLISFHVQARNFS